MKSFELAAFGSYIKWKACDLLELTLWWKSGLTNVDTTSRPPFILIHGCPISLQFVSTYRSARQSTSLLYHIFFFELIFDWYQLSKLTCQREVEENHPHYRKGNKAHPFGHFDLLEFYLQRYRSLLRQNTLECTRYGTKGEWNNRTLCINVIVFGLHNSAHEYQTNNFCTRVRRRLDYQSSSHT